MTTPTTPNSIEDKVWNDRNEEVASESAVSSNPASSTSTSIYVSQGCQELMRSFLKQHSAYDVLPVSFRLIVLDTTLLVKKALTALMQNGVVSAPLWDSKNQKFAGMLTVSDFINLIQYYYQRQYYYQHSSYEAVLEEMEKFQIQHMRDVEKTIRAPPPQLLSIHPIASLYDACKLLVESRAHRLPLVDTDVETGQEMIVSVLTQYRILKFIAMNFKDNQVLRQPLSELKIGVYSNLATAEMSTPIIQVINMFVERHISAVPIIDERGFVLNVYETVDVVNIAKSGKYHELDKPVSEMLKQRTDDFPGVHTCTLNDTLHNIFAIIRKQKVYRLIVVSDEEGGKKLRGLVSLSDILRYLIT